MSAAPRVDTAPSRPRLRRVAFARLARIRKGHVLRLEDGEPAPAVREGPGLTEAQERLERFTVKEMASFLQKPEKHSTAERDALILAYARQVEALGIAAEILLSEAAGAEREVLRFERWSGRALDVMRFSLTREGFACLTPEEWKALNVFPEIIRKVPNALGCPRVRLALKWLHASHILFKDKELPHELGELLDDIGKAIASPKKNTGWKQSEREKAILFVWRMRKHLSHDARQKAAKALGLGSNLSKKEESDAWNSVERQAKRYEARAQAKKPRPPPGEG